MTIRFSQVDAAGIVFYPRYFEMIYRAFTAAAMPSPPFAMRTRFLRPNRLGDRLTLVRELGQAPHDWAVSGRMDGVEQFRVHGLPTGEDEASDPPPPPSAFRSAMETVQDWMTDGRGRLLLSRYFERLSDVIEEWFDARLGMSFRNLHIEDAVGIPTVSFVTACRGLPAVDSRIRVAIHPSRIGNRSVELTSWLEDDEDWLVRTRQVIVFVRMQAGGFRSRPIPGAIRGRLEAEFNERTARGT